MHWRRNHGSPWTLILVATALIGWGGPRSLLADDSPEQTDANRQGVAATQSDTAATAVDRIDLATDDAAYLAQLGFVLGHLRVAVVLYAEGAPRMGDWHLKEIADTLEAPLMQAVEARQAEVFSAELRSFYEIYGQRVAVAELESAQQRVEAALQGARSVLPSTTADGQSLLLLGVISLVERAALRYERGVSAGRVVSAHDYQAAQGYVEVARKWIAKKKAGKLNPSQRRKLAKALKRVLGRFDELLERGWPSLHDPAQPTISAADLRELQAQLRRLADELR